MSAPQPIDRVPSTQFTPEAQRHIGFFGPAIPVHVIETTKIAKKALPDLPFSLTKRPQPQESIPSATVPAHEMKRSSSFDESELFP